MTPQPPNTRNGITLEQEVIAVLHGGNAEDVISQYRRVNQPRFVTELPDAAKVGDEVNYAADKAAGVYWRLAYLPDGSLYPWKYLGGPSVVSVANVNDAIIVTAPYIDFATVGPSLTIALPGTYDWRLRIQPNGMAAFANASIAVNVAGVITGSGHVFTESVGGNDAREYTDRFDVTTGGALCKMQYSSGTAGAIANRRLIAHPVRVARP